MKQKKTCNVSESDKKTCKLCGFVAKNPRGLASHIIRIHKDITMKKYFETFYPMFCCVCNKQLEFKGDKYFQYFFCSQKCFGLAIRGKIPKNKGCLKYAEEELLEELRNLHKKYNGYVTQNLMRTNGKYNYQTYHKYFGSWVEACKKAGVPYVPRINYSYSNKIISTPLPIIIDTRESQPYCFENYISKKLDFGDYALEDYESGNIVIERKSIGDLKNTFSSQTNRFCNELDRARLNKTYIVIFADCDRESFFKTPNLFGKMSNRSIYHNIKLVCSKYADCCQILFTGSKKNSNKLVFWILAHEKEYIAGIDLQDHYSNKTELFEDLDELLCSD